MSVCELIEIIDMIAKNTAFMALVKRIALGQVSMHICCISATRFRSRFKKGIDLALGAALHI